MWFLNWLLGLFRKKAEPWVPVPTPLPVPTPTPVPQPIPTPAPAPKDYPWMALLKSKMGIKEIAGPRFHPDIEEMHDATGGWDSDEVPWCGSALAWAFIKCNLMRKGEGGKNWALAHTWSTFGEKSSLIYGAIVVLTYKDKQGKTRFHVTTCNGKASGGKFPGLGGNQSNSLNVTMYPVTHIYAIRWPKGYPKLK